MKPGEMPLRAAHQVRNQVAKWIFLLVLCCGLVSPLPRSAASGPPSPSAAPTASVSVSVAAAVSQPAAVHKPSAVPTPIPATNPEDIIAFVGEAIAWYQQFSGETRLVEEPSESLYLAADQSMADEAIGLAFDYAQAEAKDLSKLAQPQSAAASNTASIVQSRLAEAQTHIAALQTQIKTLSARLKTAPRRQRDGLARQLMAVQAELELAQSRVDFLTTMEQFERTTLASPSSSLEAQIDELRRSLQNQARPKIEPVMAARSSAPAGIVELGGHLLDLQRKVASIEQRIAATEGFARSVASMRAPLLQEITLIDSSAGQLAQEAPANDRTTIEQRKQDFEHLIARRKLLGAALLPLTKETVLLRRYSSNLVQWREQVQHRIGQLLHALLLRLAALAFLVALVFTLGIIWRRVAVRYVEDVNRRRQILKVRDITVVILLFLLLLFNFTTELGALATVIGFAAAGIAVALQDVILSIAGYFRLSGRFGIKHGDRVELQGVRGEVVEIGLIKLTLLELGGDGIQSGPTGRLVMIPNSSVFREKFVNYPSHSLMIWREIQFTLAPECDFRVLEKHLLEVVEEVFARYRDQAQSQLKSIERNLNIRIDSPRPQSRVRLGPSGLQITLRYPVDARYEAQVADEISRRLLDFLAREPGLRFVPQAPPNIQAVAPAASADAPGDGAQLRDPDRPGQS